MFALDSTFLSEAGITGLSAAAERSLLQRIHSEVESRVGQRLAAGLSDAQLVEFERINGRDDEFVRAWLTVHSPHYTADPFFRKVQAHLGPDTEPGAVRAQYADGHWLSLNRPDYQMIVTTTLAELREEIAARIGAL